MRVTRLIFALMCCITASAQSACSTVVNNGVLDLAGSAICTVSSDLSLTTLRLGGSSTILVQGRAHISVTGNATIDPTASITGTGQGHAAGSTPWASGVCAGGSHGGLGGVSLPGGTDTSLVSAPTAATLLGMQLMTGLSRPHGDFLQPSNQGSGGCNAAGGASLRLTVLGVLDMQGQIAMNGGSTAGGQAGAGAGGSVWITAGTLTATAGASLLARGGDAVTTSAGAGGRIAVYCAALGPGIDPCALTVSAAAGVAASGTAAGAGTVFIDCGNVCNRTLIVSNRLGGSSTLRAARPTVISVPGAIALPVESIRVESATAVFVRDNNSSLTVSTRRFSGDNAGSVWMYNGTTLLLASTPARPLPGPGELAFPVVGQELSSDGTVLRMTYSREFLVDESGFSLVSPGCGFVVADGTSALWSPARLALVDTSLRVLSGGRLVGLQHLSLAGGSTLQLDSLQLNISSLVMSGLQGRPTSLQLNQGSFLGVSGNVTGLGNVRWSQVSSAALVAGDINWAVDAWNGAAVDDVNSMQLASSTLSVLGMLNVTDLTRAAGGLTRSTLDMRSGSSLSAGSIQLSATVLMEGVTFWNVSQHVTLHPSARVVVRGTWNVSSGGNLSMLPGSVVNGNGGGSAAEQGPGAPLRSDGITRIGDGWGAAHAGCGGASDTGLSNGVCSRTNNRNAIHGSVERPAALGSGGAAWAAAGGSGGAAISFTVRGVATLNGTVSVDGQPGGTSCSGGGGGGSGGSLDIFAEDLAISVGTVSARGGNGGNAGSACSSSTHGWGGSGGRLSIRCSRPLFALSAGNWQAWPLSMSAVGGTTQRSASGTYFSVGNPGTVFVDCGALARTITLTNADADRVNRPLRVDPDIVSMRLQELRLTGYTVTYSAPGLYFGGLSMIDSRLQVDNTGGTVTIVGAALTLVNTPLTIENRDTRFSIAGPIAIGSSSPVVWFGRLELNGTSGLVASSFTSSGRGHGPNTGPGTGGASQGASHAGCGARHESCSSSTYGDAFSPIEVGSGGRSGDCGITGGSGGGSLRLSVSGDLTLSAPISVYCG